MANDMAASTSSSLFDIIVTIIIVLLIIVIVISKIIIITNAIAVSYLFCPPLNTVPCQTHSHEQSVMSKLKKGCTCLCRVKQAPPTHFESLTVNLTRRDISNLLDLYIKQTSRTRYLAYLATKSLLRISLFFVKQAWV